MTAIESASRATSPPAPTSGAPSAHRATLPEGWWRPAPLHVIVAAVSAGVFFAAHRSLADDAMITLSYARNLAEHGEWALVHGLPANTATSPLNVWLLAAPILLIGRPVVACGLLFVAVLVVSSVWLRQLAGTRGAALGALVLLTSPLLTSTIGLETYLAVTVMIGLVRYGLAGRWPVVAVLVSAAVLTRPDMLPVALVLVVGAAWTRQEVRRPVLAVAAAAVVPLAWHGFTWWQLGSFVPDTMPAKQTTVSSWGSWRYSNGVGSYLLDFPSATYATVGLVLAGVLALGIAVTRRQVAPMMFAAAGATSAATFSALGVAPAPYYYGPLVAGFGLCVALLAAQPQQHLPGARAVLAGLVAVLAFSGLVDVGPSRGWSSPPVRVNWATNAEYAAAAARVPDGATYESPGEIGALAFYCYPRCRVVDFLSDPGRMAPYLAQWRAAHPGLLGAANFARYRWPAPTPVQGKVIVEVRPPDRPGDLPASFLGRELRAMRVERN